MAFKLAFYLYGICATAEVYICACRWRLCVCVYRIYVCILNIVFYLSNERDSVLHISECRLSQRNYLHIYIENGMNVI